ncbi:hypothetical protein R3P38DRAFT_3296202 [Favolaschia claudopus]|uniref:Uncharacterized protein n=1 Tax=Favolaschia claudopus TaxID=2862362 RepID=A0AAV9ZAY6_9AGAR
MHKIALNSIYQCDRRKDSLRSLAHRQTPTLIQAAKSYRPADDSRTKVSTTACTPTPPPCPPSSPLSPLDPTGNLSAIDINLLAPPYTVDNIVQYILQRETKDVGIAASAQVYIDHKDANPALGGAIVDIMGASTQPAKAIRVVLPGGEAPAPIWTLTAQYTVTDVQAQRWIDSRKYLHEHTMEVVQYLAFSPGDTFTTDLVRHRLDTPGYISVWKVTKVSDGKVGYVESYEYDSRYTRTKNMGGTQKPVPW